jgi:hypothetical protein
MRRFGTTLGCSLGLAGVLGASVATLQASVNQVCVHHKEGTPAQQYLLVDDDSTVLHGHLEHGDTIVDPIFCGVEHW